MGCVDGGNAVKSSVIREERNQTTAQGNIYISERSLEQQWWRSECPIISSPHIVARLFRFVTPTIESEALERDRSI